MDEDIKWLKGLFDFSESSTRRKQTNKQKTFPDHAPTSSHDKCCDGDCCHPAKGLRHFVNQISSKEIGLWNLGMESQAVRVYYHYVTGVKSKTN